MVGAGLGQSPGLTLKPRKVEEGRQIHDAAREEIIEHFIDAAVAQDGAHGGGPLGTTRVNTGAGESGKRGRRNSSGHRGRKKLAAEMGKTERLTVSLPGPWIAAIDGIAKDAGRSRNDLVKEVLRRALRLGTDPLDEILNRR